MTRARAETFNGHTYYDVGYTDNSANRRTAAWIPNTFAGYYVWGMPNEPDHQYLKAVVENENFTYLYNWYHWVGQFNRSPRPVTVDHLTSCSTHRLTAIQSCLSDYTQNGNGIPYNMGNMYFMDNYGGMVLLCYQMVTNHSLHGSGERRVLLARQLPDQHGDGEHLPVQHRDLFGGRKAIS